MDKQTRLLPPGWCKRVAVMAAAALAGNYLLGMIPWPEFMLSGYRKAAESPEAGGYGFLLLTLLAAPAAEEGIFRFGIYGGLRKWSGLRAWQAALLSSMAFGLYHGNWIQGIYACFTGLVLAWGYESSSCHKYLMAVFMHMAANLAAVAVFGLPGHT